jgi:hypothetical protein
MEDKRHDRVNRYPGAMGNQQALSDGVTVFPSRRREKVLKRIKKTAFWRYIISFPGIMPAVLILALYAQPVPAVSLKPEILHYTADLAMFKDAASATISFRELGKDRFEGVMEGQTNGIIGAFTANRRDRYATTMQMVQGKLQPLLYTEEAKIGSKHIYKEYRFDYTKQRLEMWRRNKDGVMVLKWETELTQPIYDPISAFYNFRIGALGEVKAGNTLYATGIPYPHPETMMVQVGPQESNARQATVTIRQRVSDDEIGEVHVRFDDNLVPVAAWTKVALIGKISGRLVSRN